MQLLAVVSKYVQHYHHVVFNIETHLAIIQRQTGYKVFWEQCARSKAVYPI